MLAFLIFADLLFIIFAILFFLFPKTVVTLSKLANQVLVYTDEKVYAVRKTIGILCLAMAIFLTIAIMMILRLIK
jgi:hypothetical protein